MKKADFAALCRALFFALLSRQCSRHAGAALPCVVFCTFIAAVQQAGQRHSAVASCACSWAAGVPACFGLSVLHRCCIFASRDACVAWPRVA